ncbi:MAG: hypothetical protein DA328_09195 [Nitrososphaeraceae archaeon]|nr:hypothetical protein [Nitrososphaeraceae archaeon]
MRYSTSFCNTGTTATTNSYTVGWNLNTSATTNWLSYTHNHSGHLPIMVNQTIVNRKNEAKQFKYQLMKEVMQEFNHAPIHHKCQFNWLHSPFDYQAKKSGITPQPCEQIPEFRTSSYQLGVPLDMCKEHHKITIEWHNDTFGKNPAMVKKFTQNELAPIIKEKLEKQRIALEKMEMIAKANTRADELLQKWLSQDEYQSLKENNELELPSQYENDTVYIVKKRFSEKVIKRVNKVDKEALCVMPLDENFVNDDSLLAKILFIKTDEKGFLQMANHYPLVRT